MKTENHNLYFFGILSSIKTNYLTILFFLIIILFVASCDVNNDDDEYEPPSLEVNFPQIDQYPAFSPDGNRIMYYHLGISKINSDGSFTINPDSAGLWIINSDGTNPHLIMKGKNIYADWAPSGNWIVINQGGQIFKAPFFGDSINITEIVQLTFEGKNFFPSWHPDGLWIAYDSNVDSPNGMQFIWKMKPDGTQKTRIAYEPTKGEIRMPSWSKEGSKIVHTRYSSEFFSTEVFIMDANGNNQIRITYNESTDYYPKYSPDGKRIVFESQAESDVPKVWTMNSEGDNLMCLTNYGGVNPDYSITGKIAYINYNYRIWQNNEKANGTIWIMNEDGSNKQQLTFGSHP